MKGQGGAAWKSSMDWFSYSSQQSTYVYGGDDGVTHIVSPTYTHHHMVLMNVDSHKRCVYESGADGVLDVQHGVQVYVLAVCENMCN